MCAISEILLPEESPTWSHPTARQHKLSLRPKHSYSQGLVCSRGIVKVVSGFRRLGRKKGKKNEQRASFVPLCRNNVTQPLVSACIQLRSSRCSRSWDRNWSLRSYHSSDALISCEIAGGTLSQNFFFMKEEGKPLLIIYLNKKN
jgi:hypothetical protein